MSTGDVTPVHELFDLTGRVAVVTGGTRGLGRAIVDVLAAAGADIVVSSRKPEACEEVAAEIRATGRRAVAVACHVAHWDECDASSTPPTRSSAGSTCSSTMPASHRPTPTRPSVTEELWDKTIARQPERPVPAHRPRRQRG